jgi:hypothetical protein
VLSTLVVTSAADSGKGSLRAAIAAAQGGDTIRFAPGLGGRTIHLTGGELAIGDDLTIDGPGAGQLVVDAGGLSRVFDITSPSADVMISGLTISGGNAELGGGLLDQGGALTLADDVVSNDQAVGVNPGDSAQGGGVAVIGGGSLRAIETTFADDLALGAGGSDGGNGRHNGIGGSGAGGAIYQSGAKLILSGDTFRSNQALGGPGGSGGSGAGSSSGPAFNDSGGVAEGGGIFVQSGALSVVRTSFVGDVARGGDGGLGLGGPNSFNGSGGAADGGAVQIEPNIAGPLSFAGDTFASNAAQGGDGANLPFGLPTQQGRGGAASGGAIASQLDQFGFAFSGPTITVSGSRFTGNLVQGGANGQGVDDGFSIQGAAIRTTYNLGVASSTFTDNLAIAAGGGDGVTNP